MKQTATLGPADREPGMPVLPDHRGAHIAKAVVKVEIHGSGTSAKYFPTAVVTLVDYPDDPFLANTQIQYGAGYRSGASCNVVARFEPETIAADTKTYHLTGGYNTRDFATPKKPWNCAAVRLWHPAFDTDEYLDRMVGAFSNTYHSPKVSISGVRLLGKKVTKLPLVRSSTTRIEITVRNTGKTAARNVTLTGKASGLTFGKVKVGTVPAGGTRTVSAKVKLTTKRKSTKLTLTAAGTGTSAKKKITVRAEPKPKKPRAGKYRNTSSTVRFSVKKGKITGFRATVQTRYGIAPEQYRYSTVTYDFPAKKIPRNGIVQATAKGKNWSTNLRVRVVGGKAKSGLFSYKGPDYCSATKTFTAKRVGK